MDSAYIMKTKEIQQMDGNKHQVYIDRIKDILIIFDIYDYYKKLG